LVNEDFSYIVQRDGDEGPSDKRFAFLSDREVDKCLLVLNDPQHRAIFLLLAELGLSINEILGNEEMGIRGLYVQDVRPEKLLLKVHYKVWGSEEKTMREVPLTPSCVIALRDHLASGGNTFEDFGKIFDISERMVRHFLSCLPDKAEIDMETTQMVLRRTAIVRMLKAGVRPEEVRRRMGLIRKREEPILYAAAFFVPDSQDFQRFMDDLILRGMSLSQPLLATSGFSANK
jgi:hypothetical protein